MRKTNVYLTLIILMTISIGIIYLSIKEYKLMEDQDTNTYLNNETEKTVFKTFNDIDELLEYISKTQANIQSIYKVGGVETTLGRPDQLLSQEIKATYVVGTNVQVEGVDEGDYVKISEELLVVARENKVYIIKSYPPESITIVKTIYTRNDSFIDHLFLINGDRLAIIYQSIIESELDVQKEAVTDAKRDAVSIMPIRVGRQITIIDIYDVSTPDNPVLLWRYNSTGLPIATRSIGNNIFLILQEPIYRIMMTTLSLEKSLPLINNQTPLPRKTYYSPSESYAMPIVVMKIDVLTGTMDYSVVFAPPIERIYMSGTNVYLFSTSYESLSIDVNKLLKSIEPFLPENYRQAITKIMEITGISDELKTQMIISVLQEAMTKMNEQQIKAVLTEIENQYREQNIFVGPVTHVLKIELATLAPTTKNKYWGALLDQFAIHEDNNGNLVLALTAEKAISIKIEYVPGGIPYIYPVTQSVNRVVVSNKNLQQISSLEDLAPGERIYSSRFIKDVLYLVTYRQIDPLYAIDLKDPYNPRTLGYLKVPGFSEYLHPISNDLLLGVGLSEEMRIKVSLFDVSNPTEPKEIDSLEIGLGSPVLYDHKAFNYDPRTQRAIIPIIDKDEDLSGLMTIKISNGRLQIISKHDHKWCDRGFFVDTYILSVSRDLVRVWLNDRLVNELELR